MKPSLPRLSLRSIIRRSSLCLAAVLLLLGARLAHAQVTVVDTTGSSDTPLTVGNSSSNLRFGTLFDSGAGGALNSVSATFADASSSNLTGFSLGIYTSTGGTSLTAPLGSLVVSLSGPSPTTAGTYTYTGSGTLAPSTAYWLIFGGTASATTGSFQPLFSYTPGAGTYGSEAFSPAGTYAADNPGTFLFSVTLGFPSTAPTATRPHPMPIVEVVNISATASALFSGVPTAMAAQQAHHLASNAVLSDVNGHLFSLRAGESDEVSGTSLIADANNEFIEGEGDGNPDKAPHSPEVRFRSARNWDVFSSIEYGSATLHSISNQAGLSVDSWAPSVGVGRRLGNGFNVGFALSYLESDQTYSGHLGSVKLSGPALSAYVSYVKKSLWTDLLYSWGTYDMDNSRNAGLLFPQAKGSTTTTTNALQWNAGWNFKAQKDTLVTGPFIGLDYLHGSIDAYSEQSGGLAALRYGSQSYDSLVSRVGWSVSKKIKTSWASITPQLRVGWERENLEDRDGVSVALLNSPYYLAQGGKIISHLNKPYALSVQRELPGQSYATLGAGINFRFSDRFSTLLDYEGRFFRSDLEEHFFNLKLSYRF